MCSVLARIRLHFYKSGLGVCIQFPMADEMDYLGMERRHSALYQFWTGVLDDPRRDQALRVRLTKQPHDFRPGPDARIRQRSADYEEHVRKCTHRFGHRDGIEDQTGDPDVDERLARGAGARS